MGRGAPTFQVFFLRPSQKIDSTGFTKPVPVSILHNTKMEFIIIFEQNHKEDEHLIHYCQWTGNEAELEKLFMVLENADYEELLGGDYSSFWYSSVKIPESAVDIHMKIEYPFYKHTGTFVCPSFREDPYKAAKDLHRFYAGRIGDYFRVA